LELFYVIFGRGIEVLPSSRIIVRSRNEKRKETGVAFPGPVGKLEDRPTLPWHWCLFRLHLFCSRWGKKRKKEEREENNRNLYRI